MFFVPVGILGESMRRMPYVSIGIAGLCAVAFLGTWVLPKNPLGDGDERVGDVTEYWKDHLNAPVPTSLLKRVSKAQREELQALHVQQLEELGPVAPDVLEELSRLDTAANGAGAETALTRWSLRRDKPLAQRGLLTYMFLHLGWMHLIFNLLFFYMTAVLLEDVWGRPLFAGFYLVGGMAAGAAEWALSRQEIGIVVGASGAVAACMGAFAVRYATSQVRIAYLFFLGMKLFRGTFLIPAWVAGGLWLGRELLSLVLGDGQGVAVLCHIGGFAFGMVVALGIKASGLEAKYLAPAIDRDGVVYERAPQLDLAESAFADGDHVAARKLAQEVLQKTPESPEAEVLLYRVERAQNLGNAANARLDRLMNRALAKNDDVSTQGLLAELGESFDPKAVRPPTAARLLEKFAGRNDLGETNTRGLLEVASAALGLPGAKALLRRAETALNDGDGTLAKSLIAAAHERSPDAPELAAQRETLERRLTAEVAGDGSTASTAAPAPPPRFRSAEVVGASDAFLELRDPAGKTVQLPWAKIQAVAAALASTGAPPRYVPVTDLVLAWGDSARGPEVVRIAAPSLGLAALYPGVPPRDAYGRWLKDAIDRSGATVLPDKEAILRGEYAKFGSVEEMTASLYLTSGL